MIDEVKSLLLQREIAVVAVVDDAYDERPLPGDIDDSRWDRFFDDIDDADEALLRDRYGSEAYERSDTTTLRRNDTFVAVVWQLRDRLKPAPELVSDYVRVLETKRADLSPLLQLLGSLGLTCQQVGREYSAATADANIIFLDLFLGHQEAEAAVTLAIERVKDVVAKRKDSPPLVVLMSASPHLEQFGVRVRDDAELLGCQFRMVRKSELADTNTMLERLFDLLISYPDSLRLNAFVQAWSSALDRGKHAFLRTIRTLDLADYANMQALVLAAEEERVGDYVVDLYDLHLHHVIEGDLALIKAARALNDIGWNAYPPAQFMPSSEVVTIMDGSIFHNDVRTATESDLSADPRSLRLGDVFLREMKSQPISSAGAEADVAMAGTVAQSGSDSGFTRDVYVVLSQACDLQHSDADRILLLKGAAVAYSWKNYENAKPPRTPVMKVGEELFAIEWDLLAPETWLLSDIPGVLASGSIRRVRRFRTPFALQLQQSFIGRLGRVGTPAALPGRHPAGVKIFVRKRNNDAHLLLEAAADDGDAVCLVGRTEKNKLKEWLLLSEKLRRQMRNALAGLRAEDINQQIANARENLSFFTLFKRGLVFARDNKKGSRPFAGTNFDLVQVLTRPTVTDGQALEQGLNHLIIEVAIG